MRLMPRLPLLQKVKKKRKNSTASRGYVSFLKNILHLSEDESTLNACRMEHIMTEEMFSRIKSFSAFIQDYCSKTKTLAVRLKPVQINLVNRS